MLVKYQFLLSVYVVSYINLTSSLTIKSITLNLITYCISAEIQHPKGSDGSSFFEVLSAGPEVSDTTSPCWLWRCLHSQYFLPHLSSKDIPKTLSGLEQRRASHLIRETGECIPAGDSAVSSPDNYMAFAAYGFHPVGAGIPWLPSGAQIGIPSNFNSTPDDLSGITNRTILIDGKEVEWDSETGSTLKNTLVLSEDAQKFTMAREVARLECAGPVLHAAVAPTCLAGAWIYSVALKQIFGLFARSVILRAGVNTLALGLGAVSYFLATNAVNQWLEFHSDRRAASLSHNYMKGGVEFYEKILERNKTLRVLMGPRGEEMYTPSGNLFPASLMSMKHAPYTLRRDKILNLQKEEKA